MFCTVQDGFSWGLVSDDVPSRPSSGSVDDGLLSRHNTQNSVDNGDGIRLLPSPTPLKSIFIFVQLS